MFSIIVFFHRSVFMDDCAHSMRVHCCLATTHAQQKKSNFAIFKVYIMGVSHSTHTHILTNKYIQKCNGGEDGR